MKQANRLGQTTLIVTIGATVIFGLVATIYSNLINTELKHDERLLVLENASVDNKIWQAHVDENLAQISRALKVQFLPIKK